MSILYVVGTPIGNLEDIGQRALRVLTEADLIAAEDTRVTHTLLERYGINTPLTTYTDAYDRQKAARTERVLEALNAGRRVALVSDAGMPGLADPGYELIRAALAAGHQVVVVPGPSAVTAALVASGLPTDRFLYIGYLPRRAAARRALLAELADEPGTIVAFEAPHRLLASLQDLLEVLGDRQIAVSRELTKRFEEIWRGPVSQALAYFTANSPRGEITLVIAGAGRSRSHAEWSQAQVAEAVELLRAEGLSAAAIARVVARLSGWERSRVYALAAADET